MSLVPSERKSWGPLIATIDLLFLVVAFFTLMLFFVQRDRQQVRQELSHVEQSLGAPPASGASSQAGGNALVELVDRLMAIQKADQDHQAQLQSQEERRRTRQTLRMNYEVLPGGRIAYDNRTYSPQDFRNQVVVPLRGTHWLAFRAYAPPETPFGDVVATRKLLLENGGEFDTYWDNLAEGAAAPR